MELEAKTVKRFLVTIILAAVFAGLLAYAFFYERGPTKKEKTEEAKKVTALKVDIDKLKRIEISGGYKSLTLEKKSGTWRIVAPLKTRAAKFAVENIVDNLKELKADSKVESDAGGKKVNLADFGLDAPQLILTAALQSGRKETLKIGSKTPVGENYYVMKQGDPSVYVIPGYIIDSFRKTENDLRDRSIADSFNRDDVSAVALLAVDKKTVCVRRAEKEGKKGSADTKSKGKKAGGKSTGPAETAKKPEWHFEGRDTADCGTEADSIMSDLEMTEAAGFIDQPAPKLSDYGLDKPLYILEIRFSGNKPLRFEAGSAQVGNFYLRNISRKEIYGVDKRFIDTLESLKKASSKL